MDFREMYSAGGDFGDHGLAILARMKELEQVMDDFGSKYGKTALWWLLLSYLVQRENQK